MQSEQFLDIDRQYQEIQGYLSAAFIILKADKRLDNPFHDRAIFTLSQEAARLSFQGFLELNEITHINDIPRMQNIATVLYPPLADIDKCCKLLDFFDCQMDREEVIEAANIVHKFIQQAIQQGIINYSFPISYTNSLRQILQDQPDILLNPEHFPSISELMLLNSQKPNLPLTHINSDLQGLSDKPTIVIVAGPNGAGKTLYVETLKSLGLLDNFITINPDAIAQDIYGDWNSQDNILKATLMTGRLRHELLDE